MDYLTLLKLYMRHIIDCEGIDFVNMIENHRDSPQWTEQQRKEIKRLSNEIRNGHFG